MHAVEANVTSPAHVPFKVQPPNSTVNQKQNKMDEDIAESSITKGGRIFNGCNEKMPFTSRLPISSPCCSLFLVSRMQIVEVAVELKRHLYNRRNMLLSDKNRPLRILLCIVLAKCHSRLEACFTISRILTMSENIRGAYHS